MSSEPPAASGAGDSVDDLACIRNSRFFDAGWYGSQDGDPAEHYLRHGAVQGRDPGPLFDAAAYAARWPEVARGEINPLVHFARWIDGEEFGRLAETLVRGSALFDADWYLAAYPDVARAGLDPAEHFLAVGAAQECDPGPLFSTAGYHARRPDVAAAGMNPLVHFLLHGITEDGVDLAALAAPPPPPAAAPVARRRKLGRKAVFVTHDLNIGGAPALLRSIAAWFERATDYDVHIVAMAGGPLLEAFREVAPVHVVGGIAVADDAVPVLRQAVRDFLGEEPAFTFVNSVAAGDYCRIDPFDAPTFGYVHERAQVLAIFRDQAEPLMARARHIFCGAHEVHDMLAAAWPEHRDRLSTRPSFIAAPPDAPSAAAIRAGRRRRLGFAPDRALVVGCGVAHWRKQPLVFVAVAARLIRERGRAVDFAWIGDGEDVPAMRRLAEQLGIADRLHLLGNRDDFRAVIAAADVFALTSSEDSFPLVCLEAGAAGAPVVAFREATGFARLIAPDAAEPGGAAVPLGDEEAFADAVDALLADEPRRVRAGAALRARILAGYTEDRACTELLGTIRAVAGLAPRVSVVVPSYNSAPFLAERLASLAAQTFRDVELLLLDDGSRDESPRLLEAFAADHPEARLLLAPTNGGSVFRAWERGIRAAAGDFVWIAEADDFCEPAFLERALDAFAPSGTRLVHGRSIPVGPGGGIAGDWNDLYLDAIRPGGWQASFCAPAAQEVNRALGRANTIPNVSAVVVRRAAALRAIELACAFRLAGDWAFYIAAIHGGRIGYAHEAVNYHRRHPDNVTAFGEGSAGYFRELADVGAAIRMLYGAEPERDAAFARHLADEARRFGYTDPLPAGRAPPALAATAPGILYGVGDLSGGGAQMFAVRLVNAWARGAAPAVLLVTGQEPDHPALVARIDPLVPVVTLADIAAEGGLAALLRAYGLDVVVSGHWWADAAIGRYREAEAMPQPWVIVMHGCYETVLGDPDSFAGVGDALRLAERHCDHWVWVADKNRQVFAEGHVAPRADSHIVSGFAPPAVTSLTRADLGVADGALVFLLAGRAIVAKGWHLALAAFAELRERAGDGRDLRLLLIGDGPVADELRAAPLPAGVHAIPHTARLDDHLALADVCLLPSWFLGESLPLVVIEALAHGKPAIVSDIGRCGWAIDADAAGAGAGFVLPRDGPDGTVRRAALVAAMARFVDDPALAGALRPAALAAARKFDMQRMTDRYRALFEAVLAERAGAARPARARTKSGRSAVSAG